MSETPTSHFVSPNASTLANESIKPRKGSFLFKRIVGAFVFSIVLGLAIALLCIAAQLNPLVSVFSSIIAFALLLVSAWVAYRKERYEITDSTLIAHQGGLTSDQRTEVEIRNVTYVTLTLPWIRHHLFGIGTIKVYSAGNAQPVVLRDILEPQRAYESVKARMQKNGYQLQKQKLLHKESPAILGVISDLASIGVGALFSLFVLSSALVGARAALAEYQLSWIIVPLGLIGFAAAIAYSIAFYLDMRRRTYSVYDDVVIFHEGFLTKRDAFIPYENIADASTNRTFFDQIFNLYDVVVSCQGSSTEIKFRRLKNGPQLARSIEILVTEANRNSANLKATLSPATLIDATQPKRKEPALVAPENAWTAELKMNQTRAFVPLFFLLPVFPAFVAAAISKAIMVFSMRFSVRQSSIRHTYQFLSTKEREFVYDKITGLVIKENIFDRVFKTFTLRFWSIGSGQSIEFAHVLRSEVNLDALLRQVGIPNTSAQVRDVKTAFSLSTWVRKNIVGLSFAFCLILASIVFSIAIGEALVFLIPFVVAALVMARFAYELGFYRKQSVRFKDHHIEATQGIITRSSYFARYSNVKKNIVSQYPWGTEGSLQIFVAGEQSPPYQQQQKGGQGIALPCSFTLGHLSDAFTQGELLDDVLMGRVEVTSRCAPKEQLPLIAESKKALGNELSTLILLSLVVFPMLAALPLTLPLTVLGVKRWHYGVDAGRIIASWGILFKNRSTVLLDRVDSLQERQGFLNKLFKNGRVSIMTAGSSKPDLVLNAMVDYSTVYKEIKARSKGAS